MDDYASWHMRAFCPTCDYHTECNSLGAVPFLTCCPDCGERYSWTSSGKASWRTESARWVKEPKKHWWHESKGHWERASDRRTPEVE